jgi:hypothetical protein
MNDQQGPPWKGHSHGADANLKQAFDEAWKAAKANGGPSELSVVEIQITGDNPITEYIVVVGPRD